MGFQPVVSSTARHLQKRGPGRPGRRLEACATLGAFALLRWVGGKRAGLPSALMLVLLPAALTLRIKATVPSGSAESVETRQC
jgi:hypothetical protein